MEKMLQPMLLQQVRPNVFVVSYLNAVSLQVIKWSMTTLSDNTV